MKIGVIGDTHTNKLSAEILGYLKGMDMIIHTGDLTELEVLDSLKSICPNVKAVCGNMDELDVRRCLPDKEIISVGKIRIGVTHGRGAPSGLIGLVTEIFKEDNLDIIIFGHSHSPVNQKIDSILYLNPGSLTDKIFAPYNSYGVIEINDRTKAEIVKI